MPCDEQEEPEAAQADQDARLAAWVERAGHDLRTPLAVIGGMAETLESSWDRLSEADRVHLLGAIRTQAARATALLEEGLGLTRWAPPDQR